MANITPPGYLASSMITEGAGQTMDCRHALNHGLLTYQASGQSAIFEFQESNIDSGWMTVATYTATATQTGTAQLAGFFPYVRCNVTELYTATATTTATAHLWVHWSPVL